MGHTKKNILIQDVNNLGSSQTKIKLRIILSKNNLSHLGHH